MVENIDSLIIYLSISNQSCENKEKCSNDTEVVAETISLLTGGKVIKVEPAIAYSDDYNKFLQEVKARRESHNAPIVDIEIDTEPYEFIYIVTPFYGVLMPEEIFTALKDLNFKDKMARFFVIHEGLNIKYIFEELASLCKKAAVSEVMTFRVGSDNDIKTEVENWLT